MTHHAFLGYRIYRQCRLNHLHSHRSIQSGIMILPAMGMDMEMGMI